MLSVYAGIVRIQGEGDGPHVGGGEVVMTTAATNHPEVTQREITLHPIRFKGRRGQEDLRVG